MSYKDIVGGIAKGYEEQDEPSGEAAEEVVPEPEVQQGAGPMPGVAACESTEPPGSRRS